tara:strand:- start:945 stop:1106 length:162 start_codon:yes stop_codon:yes gene_type:complete
MRKYNIEYKDRSDFGCGMEVEAQSMHEAVIELVKILLKQDNYMSELLEINEIT